MKILTNLSKVALLVLFTSNWSFAAPELDRVYFCGLNRINLKNGQEIQSTDQTMNHSTAFYQKRLIKGEVRIFEIDGTTLESKITKIPAMVRITSAGAQLRARSVSTATDNCIYSFPIYNNRGKSIESIFGDYVGGSLGISLIANLGAQFLINPSNHYTFGGESMFVGIGVNAGTYLKIELRAGAKSTDQVEVADVKTGSKVVVGREEVLKRVLQ